MGRTAGSGQGSIYKRGDKWRGQIMINGERRSFTAKKKADVIDWMSKMRTDNNAGLMTAKSNITVKELAEEWLEIKERTLTPQVHYNLRISFNRHLYPVLGKYKVQDLTKQIIENAYNKMFEEGHSDGTITLFAANFKNLLNYAVDQNIIAMNPHTRVAIKKYNNVKKVDAYSSEDQEKIVKYLKQRFEPYHALFYVLITTGMRQGEAAALTWDDIDLSKGAIDVCKTLVNIGGHKYIQHHPKTAAGVRTIYLSRNTLEYLRKYNQLHGESHYVFLNTRGTFFGAGIIGKRWKRICAELDIEYKGAHSLRHTFATRALEKGIDVKTVSKILGHSNVLTTMNRYQDVFSSQKIKAMDVLNDLF